MSCHISSGTPPDMGLCVVLLGDRLFMELPLEALNIFKGKGISSVCRDFSLLILYNRMHLAESGTGKHHLRVHSGVANKMLCI